MVVLLLLLSPVLVELVDFNSCVALLKQVKSLQVRKKAHVNTSNSHCMERDCEKDCPEMHTIPCRLH